MLSILKREFKAYFNSPIAYILIGLFTVISSLFFILINISYGSAELSGLLSNMGFILLFITPILTMRSLAEDRKNGTEVLLITSPASVGKIVLGKFFGAFAVFLVMTAITFVYPLILFIFGEPSTVPIIGGYLGFIFLGAAFIAIGIFASSLTENQIVSAIVSFTLLIVVWLIQFIGNYLGGPVAKVLNYVALLVRYDEFNSGIISLNLVVFFISFIGIFLFLATRVIEKRRWGQDKKFKYGSNSIILTVVVIAIAVVVNLISDMLDIKLDLTPNKYFTLSDTSKEILNKLDKEITIYGLFDDAQIESQPTLKRVTNLLEQYDAYSKIKVEYVDPDKNPAFLNSFDPDGTKNITKGNFLVVRDKKIKVLSSYDLYDIAYNQYTGGQELAGFKAEQGFTGAIKYVASDKTPTVYFLEGHDELNVDRTLINLKGYLQQNNYETKPLNLITQDKVPDDAEILIVASPKKDLTGDEKNKIDTFLKAGGRAVFLFDSLNTSTPFSQFEELLKDYNLSLNYDRVKENDDQRHITNAPYDIVPDILNNEINSNINSSNFYVVMPNSRSLNILKNAKEGLTVTPLMRSSSKAIGENIDASLDNIPGPLDMAAAVESKTGTTSSKILVIGNGNFISDEAINQYQQLSVNGMYFFLNSLNWLRDTTDDILIEAKSIDSNILTLTASNANITIILILIVLPLVILGTGITVFMRRRHL